MRIWASLFILCLCVYSLSASVAKSLKTNDVIKSQAIPAEIINLLDTKAKLAANYTPILALRGLAHSKIYRKKGTAHLERYYFLDGSKIPYEKILLDIVVSSTKWNDRIIEAKGIINSQPIIYKNIMELSLPKKAKMNIYCNIGTYTLLSLFVNSDGTDMTNSVVGYFAGKPVQYFTKHRLTEGILASSDYDLSVEGLVNAKTGLLELKSKGTLAEVQIEGEGRECPDGHFEFTERFNNILVKSYLHISEN